MMEEEWGQSTSLQPEEGAPSLPHPAQLFPTQNTTRVQETVGTPEGRKGFGLHFHFVQNAALLTSAGDSPPPARWIVQGTGTKPHKGTTAPAETRSPFCRSSAQRTRAPGLDGILGDEQPHPSHPERKTQRKKSFGCFTLLSPPAGKCRKDGEGSARKIFILSFLRAPQPPLLQELLVERFPLVPSSLWCSSISLSHGWTTGDAGAAVEGTAQP